MWVGGGELEDEVGGLEGDGRRKEREKEKIKNKRRKEENCG